MYIYIRAYGSQECFFFLIKKRKKSLCDSQLSQAAEIGMAHNDVLRHLVMSALRRKPGFESISPAMQSTPKQNLNADNTSGGNVDVKPVAKQQVFVLFGGGTSERQVISRPSLVPLFYCYRYCY